MPSKILVIDDDKFIHKVITRSLEPVGFTISCSLDGDSGIAEALKYKPNIILLDVEMPGANGYEVCQRIKAHDDLKGVAIVFLSSQSTLRERLQGYEVGADDYLTKPFEKEHLIARLKVLSKYQAERSELTTKYQLAQKTALSALTGTSEISIVMQFMEKTIRHNSLDDVISGLIDTTNKFSIDCCICIPNDSGPNIWHSSDGAVSPIEKELVEMSDPSKRFMDFGCRTVVNYHPVKMLVKNMPLEDMDRYGRLKDLLPVLLSIVNTKLSSIKTYIALIDQSKDLQFSFTDIRKNLFTLASTIVDNRGLSKKLSESAVQELNMKLMGMGLEAEQETYLLELIEASFSDTLKAIDMGEQLRNSFSFILDNLSETMAKHNSLLEVFIFSQSVKENEIDDDDKFFSLLQGFQTEYANSVASGDDLKDYLNDSSEVNFDNFFDEWYYGEGYPTYQITWDTVGTQLLFVVNQTTEATSTPLFTSAIPINIKVNDESFNIQIKPSMLNDTLYIDSLFDTGEELVITLDPENKLLKGEESYLREAEDATHAVSNAAFNFKIGPNPMDKELFISSSEVIWDEITITDLLGKVFWETSEFPEKIELNTASWNEGVYIVIAKGVNGETIAKKIIKQ